MNVRIWFETFSYTHSCEAFPVYLDLCLFTCIGWAEINFIILDFLIAFYGGFVGDYCCLCYLPLTTRFC